MQDIAHFLNKEYKFLLVICVSSKSRFFRRRVSKENFLRSLNDRVISLLKADRGGFFLEDEFFQLRL